MKLTILVTATLLTLSACSATEVVPGEAKVKIVETAPAACEFVGEVEGQYQGGSIASGVQLDKHEAARADLRRQTARQSADVVALKRDLGEHLAGDAYRCGARATASTEQK